MPEREFPTEPLPWGDVDDWPVSAPDLRPRGVILLEASLYFAGAHSDEDIDEPVDTFDWVITGHPGHLGEGTGTWHTALVGELFLCRDGWHLAVAAILPVEGRPDVYGECAESAEVEDRLGYWSSHVLWDFVSQEANRLLVGARVGFTMPAATPRPQLRSKMPEPEFDAATNDEVDLDS